MAWGIFKKIKNAFNKAKDWIRNNGKKVIKPILNTAIKLAPAIGTAIATSQGAPPATGNAIGSSIQSIGHSLGLG